MYQPGRPPLPYGMALGGYPQMVGGAMGQVFVPGPPPFGMVPTGKPPMDPAQIAARKKAFQWPNTFCRKFRSMQEFEIQKQLGKGGFSEVYRAKNRRDGRVYAVKKVDLNQINIDDFEIIRDEAGIHSQIRGEGIVEFYDWIKEGDFIYIILEYVDGQTLFEYLNRNHPLSEQFIKKVMRQILNALQHIHNQGIIHRDLKPENVLLDRQLNAKICDFGWSERKKEVNRSDDFSGTIVYMAPEILKLEQYDESVDIWTVGVLLYELFHNIEPFKGDNPQMILNCILTQPLQFEKRCPKEARDLIRYILNIDRRYRPKIPQILNHPYLRDPMAIQNTNQPAAQAQTYVASQDRYSHQAVLQTQGLQPSVPEYQQAQPAIQKTTSIQAPQPSQATTYNIGGNTSGGLLDMIKATSGSGNGYLRGDDPRSGPLPISNPASGPLPVQPTTTNQSGALRISSNVPSFPSGQLPSQRPQTQAASGALQITSNTGGAGTSSTTTTYRPMVPNSTGTTTTTSYPSTTTTTYPSTTTTNYPSTTTTTYPSTTTTNFPSTTTTTTTNYDNYRGTGSAANRSNSLKSNTYQLGNTGNYSNTTTTYTTGTRLADNILGATTSGSQQSGTVTTNYSSGSLAKNTLGLTTGPQNTTSQPIRITSERGEFSSGQLPSQPYSTTTTTNFGMDQNTSYTTDKVAQSVGKFISNYNLPSDSAANKQTTATVSQTPQPQHNVYKPISGGLSFHSPQTTLGHNTETGASGSLKLTSTTVKSQQPSSQQR